MGAIAMVVGLGNPGSEYAATRHNVGFRTVELLADEAGASWRPSPAGEGLYAEFRLGEGRLRLLKPLTYMNASGEMVGAAARFWKVPSAGVLVVSDDIDLPLGRIRIRLKGSSGGQRGLESVLSHLGTKDVPRLRLGVGPKPSALDAASFVLGRFRPEEKDGAERMIERAGEAVRCACADGLEAAMNRYNPSEGEAA